MEHLDAELLSLLALGESPHTDTDAEHLSNCPQCRQTLRDLQHAVHIATYDLRGIELEEPGAQTWAAIHQALGLSPALEVDPLSKDKSGLPLPQNRSASASVAATISPHRGEKQNTAPTPLRPSAKNTRKMPGTWLIAAAGVVLGTAAGWTAGTVLPHPGSSAPSTTQSSPSITVLAQTALTPLPTHTGNGQAQVKQLADGTRQLTVQLPDDHTAGFREVWAATTDLSGMVSLGVLANNSGTFTIPAGIDLNQYPVVDISDQPYNGNPAHSTDSIARGTLKPLK